MALATAQQLLFGALLAIAMPGPAQGAAVSELAPILAAQEIRAAAGAHRLILLGEMHGTREPSAILRHLLAAYAKEGPVLVALEVQAGEQAAFSSYLASDGSRAALAALRSGPFWQVRDRQHDGRRSVELLATIERVRRMRADGRDVALLAMDPAARESTDSQSRDEAMARRLRVVFDKLPVGRMLVLAGNVHAMREKPSYAPPEMQIPMGAYLADRDPYSVNISARAGAFWACRTSCGPAPATPGAVMSGVASDGVYDYQIVLPVFTVGRLLGAPSRSP